MHTVKLHGQHDVPLLSSSAFDLSEYVRIAADQGLDVDDGDFLAPQFGESPLGEGQPLLAVTAGNKEKVYPLALNDATAGEVVGLQRALVWHVTQNGPLRLEEEQEGGDGSVWWDVSFARFEPETNVRRAARGWRMGVLRVWVSPYATTGTSRLIATAARTAPWVQTGPIGSLAGDAPALLDLAIRVGAIATSSWNTPAINDGRIGGFCVLPNTDYDALHIVASGARDEIEILDQAGVATAFLDGLGNFGGVGLCVPGSSINPLARWHLSPASAYRGRSRVFAIARSDVAPGIALHAAGHDGRSLGPTGIASAPGAGITLVDLGVLDVPDTFGAGTYSVTLSGGQLPATGYHGPHTATWASPGLTALVLGGFILMPEDQSIVIAHTDRRPVALTGFDPTASGPLIGTVDQLGNTWATSPLATAGGLWLYPASAGFAGNYHPSLTGLQTLGNTLGAEPIADGRIEVFADVDRTTATRGNQVIVRKQITDNSFIEGVYWRSPSAAATNGIATAAEGLTLTVVENGATTVWQATAMSAGLDSDPNATHRACHLVLQTHGPNIGLLQANLETARMLVSASRALAQEPGRPAVGARATVNASLPAARLRGVRIAAGGSVAAYSGVDSFEANGASGTINQLVQGGWRADLTGRARGHIPQAAVPTCAGVAAFLVPSVGGTTLPNATLEVRVRERFTFLR